MRDEIAPGWVRHPKRGKSHRAWRSMTPHMLNPLEFSGLTKCGFVFRGFERISENRPAEEDRCRLCEPQPSAAGTSDA